MGNQEVDRTQFLPFYHLQAQDLQCHSTSQGAEMFWHLLLWIRASLPHPVCLLLHFVTGLQWVLVLWMPALSVLEQRGVRTSTDCTAKKWSVTCITTIIHKTSVRSALGNCVCFYDVQHVSLGLSSCWGCPSSSFMLWHPLPFSMATLMLEMACFARHWNSALLQWCEKDS